MNDVKSNDVNRNDMENVVLIISFTTHVTIAKNSYLLGSHSLRLPSKLRRKGPKPIIETSYGL